MKRLSALVVLVLFSISCSSDLETKKTKSINVKQNLNLEVLFTIYNQIWTPFLYEGVSESMIENTRLMKINHDYFEGFKNHEAVIKTQEFLNKSGTDFFVYGFYYDDFPSAKRVREIPEILTKDINPDRQLALEEIDSLMASIADFYSATNFEEFYNDNDYVYEMAAREASKYIPKNNFISFLEAYFGEAYTDYDFFIIPFFKAEFGMAHQIKTEKGTRNITFISPFEPATTDENNRIQYVGYESEDDILEWVVHEYSHTFFNPSLNLKTNLNRLNEFEHLYKPIEGSPQIGDWYSVFGELIAVAFEVRATTLLGDKDRSRAILERHKNWYYLEHFIAQLERYEKNREQYPSIADFMPIMIASCESLK